MTFDIGLTLFAMPSSAQAIVYVLFIARLTLKKHKYFESLSLTEITELTSALYHREPFEWGAVRVHADSEVCIVEGATVVASVDKYIFSMKLIILTTIIWRRR